MQFIKVLIVEDDPNIAELNSRTVQKLFRFRLTGIASCLEEAQDMVDTLKPDLILLDNYLPDGQGVDFVRTLQSQGSQTDIILITAARDQETIQSAMRGGVFDYVVKPIAYQRLLASLNRYLDFRQQHPADADDISQAQIDALFGHSAQQPDSSQYPKGIDALTLDKVHQALSGGGEYTAVQLGNIINVSRTTARRYLEYSVGSGHTVVSIEHGQVGRPERLYKKKPDATVPQR